MSKSELEPCPFCGNNPSIIDDATANTIIVSVYCEYCATHEREVSAQSAGWDSKKAEEDAIWKWNRRNLDHLYIHHPVTGERMDKSMCKRVITQMYDEKRAIKVKRHSTKHAIYEHCGSCNAPLSSTYSFCPNCGKKIDWSE